MLEFVAAAVDRNDTVKVEATLDGTPVCIFVSRDVIEDRLRLTGIDLDGSRIRLEENWGDFSEGLERAVRSHGNGVVVTTHMLNV